MRKCMTTFGLALEEQDCKETMHGCDFTSCGGISGFGFLAESNKDDIEMPCECDLSPFGLQTLTQSYPCKCDSDNL